MRQGSCEACLHGADWLTCSALTKTHMQAGGHTGVPMRRSRTYLKLLVEFLLFGPPACFTK